VEEPPVPDRFKGTPEAEKAWREGRKDGAELGHQTAMLVMSLYRLRWLLLAIVVAVIAFLLLL
jgi:hypothetical protein